MKQNVIIKKITRRITEDQRNLQDLCGGYDDLNTLTTTTERSTAVDAIHNNGNNR